MVDDGDSYLKVGWVTLPSLPPQEKAKVYQLLSTGWPLQSLEMATELKVCRSPLWVTKNHVSPFVSLIYSSRKILCKQTKNKNNSTQALLTLLKGPYESWFAPAGEQRQRVFCTGQSSDGKWKHHWGSNWAQLPRPFQIPQPWGAHRVCPEQKQHTPPRETTIEPSLSFYPQLP